MATNNPYQQYKQNTVDTKSPGELTLMLYDGCLKFIRRAEEAIKNKNIEVKNENLLKAQNIIRELMLTLNTDVAVSQDMMSMYDYILNQLVEANMKNDLDALKEAAKYTEDFRDTWKEVIKIDRQERHSGEKSSEPVQSAKPSTPLKAVKKEVQAEEAESAKKTATADQLSATAAKPEPKIKPNPNNPYAKAKAAGYGAPNNPYTKAKALATASTGSVASYKG
ncbi:flagellar protein FliS [[Bacillus] selenitireducens MLS10]|uniref:Flagellar protein FliS n=1 Tax=Bacillus selenitireducens (strain ATCC 700615 / DSM 15326 / MLS10) TaxID=439292 RepID=D6Y0X9_BACIE|nr:flagellar protein FliS [[Bacillus] selenitireducens MLS10]